MKRNHIKALHSARIVAGSFTRWVDRLLKVLKHAPILNDKGCFMSEEKKPKMSVTLRDKVYVMDAKIIKVKVKGAE